MRFVGYRAKSASHDHLCASHRALQDAGLLLRKKKEEKDRKRKLWDTVPLPYPRAALSPGPEDVEELEQ
ncbi:hypothetical protein E2C01_062623 [Portunus trituberculatus]|uniref:Uncharacterized protein n=1 Tax=Portunus trituberculatus TaxID=210409 RepID=A0A5B7HBM2_PORTR|nr:hypothetical protein [Portunus trituberculatus]